MSKQNIMTLHEAGKQILAAMDKWTPEEKAAFWAKLDKLPGKPCRPTRKTI